MAEPFMFRRIDVLLVDLVQELDRDFPELPYGLIARCVEVARRIMDRWPADDEAHDVVVAIEQAARDDLERIRSSMSAAAR